MQHLPIRSRRDLPAVDLVLARMDDVDLPRAVKVAIIRRVLDSLRNRDPIPADDEIDAALLSAVREFQRQRIGPVLNGTGVLIHTNLGRSPLGLHVSRQVAEAASHYVNLEFNLSTGSRGTRSDYLEQNLALLCGAEGATVVNNNAAALMLVLQHYRRSATPLQAVTNENDRQQVIRSPEVIISRGELIQIGGGFRIPDILQASGVTLREVGTTNQTTIDDYREALTPRTALLLKVHHSNFFMEGFVKSPTTSAMAALARENGIALVEDLGSGAVLPTESLQAGLEHEPTPKEVLAQGVDLVTFSGDKLLGGPQAGIVAGRKELVDSLRSEPIYRAFRCDKLILVALQTVVDELLDEGGGSCLSNSCPSIPLHAMLSASVDQLRCRGEQILRSLAGLSLEAELTEGESRIGGGAMPRSAITSVAVAIRPNLSGEQTWDAVTLAERLRLGNPPVVGTIRADRFHLDLRTILPAQDARLVDALIAALRE